MKSTDIIKAFNDIQDDFIEEAAPKNILPKKASFSWFNMRALAGAFAVLLIAIFMGNITRKPDVAVVNPYVSCSSLAEAEEITGYTLSVPDTFMESETMEISVINGTMTEVKYLENEETILTIRKGKGKEDISGDYNTYENTEIIVVNDREVTIKGNEDLYQLAVWTMDDYSYSVYSDSSLTKDTLTELIQQVQ